jgi:hypothetical protein
MFLLFFLGATFHDHHPRLLEGMVGAKVRMLALPREDKVVHDLPIDMIRTDHHRSHARVRDRDHDHHDEGVLVRKAPVSTDDEALVTVVTATVTGVGVGAPTGAEAGIVIKEELGRSTRGVENKNDSFIFY